jgi:hypothetical protein
MGIRAITGSRDPAGSLIEDFHFISHRRWNAL